MRLKSVATVSVFYWSRMSNPISKARNTNNIKSLYTLTVMDTHERQ
jgi:hypothetical protein